MTDSGNIKLSSPMTILERRNESGNRLGFSKWNNDELYKCVSHYLNMIKDWIPKKRGYSLYIRAVLMSTTVSIFSSLVIFKAKSKSEFTNSCKTIFYDFSNV